MLISEGVWSLVIRRKANGTSLGFLGAQIIKGRYYSSREVYFVMDFLLWFKNIVHNLDVFGMVLLETSSVVDTRFVVMKEK